MTAIESIALIGVFLLLLLSAFLISNKSEKRTANLLFAGFLIITSLDLSGQFLGDFYRNFTILNKLRTSLAFLQMPLLYFYVKKTCFSDFKLKPKLLWHALPTLVFLLVYLFSEITLRLEVIFVISVQIQIYTYLVASFMVLNNYRKTFENFHATQSQTYRWLLTAIASYFLANSIVLFRGVSEALNNFERFPILDLSIALFALFMVSWFVLKTMHTPELFIQVNQNEKEPTKQKVTNTPTEDVSEDLATLDAYMLNKKPFLNDTLTLQVLASETGLSAKRLSLIINQSKGTHFFDFINGYRVEEAKHLLRETDQTIQQIMFEVGFNSKSSFNMAFRKHTSLTPSAYRKQTASSKV